MDLNWIEDMLVLIEEANFSIAANRRNVSQPAFSRRIQSLEQWIGVTLVDRSTKPVTFTVSTELLEEDFRSLGNSVRHLRSKIRAASHSSQMIRIGAQQALTVTVFPELSRGIDLVIDKVAYRVHSANREECVAMLLRHKIDLLLCYETPDFRTKISAHLAEKFSLGSELLVPVIHAGLKKHMRAYWRNERPVPLLLYPQESMLGMVVKNSRLREAIGKYDVDVTCESAFSSGLKSMVLQRMGIAWLPKRLVEDELYERVLIDMSKKLGTLELEIILYWSNDSRAQLSPQIRETIANFH